MTQKPYNVLFVDSVSDIGGAEISMILFLKYLNRDLFNPIVIIPDKGPLYNKIEELGIEVITMNLTKITMPFPLGYIKTVWNLTRFIKEREIALIACHMENCNQYSLPASKINRIPIVVHTRNLIFDFRSFWRTFLHFPDVLIANSKATADSYIPFIRKHQKVKVVYNGIDLEEYSPSTNCNQIRKKYVINNEKFLIGVIARISRPKRQDVFIKAMAEVVKICPDIFAFIVGETKIDQSENYLEELHQMVKKFGLTDKVIFTGFVSEMKELYASLDLLVLPSQAEPFGRVLIEAMAMEKPVVATRAGGAAEIVENGVTGLLVPPDDIDSLAQAIIRMLENKEDRIRMGKAGRKRVENMFSIEKNIEETQKIYTEVLNHQ